MCEQLQVSRGTLRQALHILRGRGELETEGGRGHRLVRGVAKPLRGGQEVTIRFLSPEALESRRAFFSLMLDKVYEIAGARGWRVLRDHGTSYFTERAEARLERLVERGHRECWILVHSSRSTQEWFSAQQVPVIVSGHTHAGVDLPSLDVDHRASGFHAGTVLARQGHRWVAMVVSSDPFPGLMEGENGFRESFEGTGQERRISRLVHKGCDGDLARNLGRLFGKTAHPSAIIVETPGQYIVAFSVLARLRKVVPVDVSLISRLDDPYMRHFDPVPARYRLDPGIFSRTLVKMVAHLMDGESLNPRIRKIIPEFVPGRSTGVERAN
jgi:DNA-binding LacI/PurR family transcriptional regulator